MMEMMIWFRSLWFMISHSSYFVDQMIVSFRFSFAVAFLITLGERGYQLSAHFVMENVTFIACHSF